MSIERALLNLLYLAGPLALAQAGLFALRSGWDALGAGFDALVSVGGAVAFVAGAAAHELLHGLGWTLAGGLRRGQVRYGFILALLTPYAHPLVPLRARAYRLGALVPLLALGLAPYVAGLASARGALAAYGILFTLAAGGDLAVLWKMRGVPAGRWVKDHPTRAGCEVLGDPAEPRGAGPSDPSQPR